ncbi:MAG: hypothetical protein JW384_01510 [Nitrosomonadaceae bacterium]|nr:hypothetical protein [Nitrosomonadaceae bacterium]
MLNVRLRLLLIGIAVLHVHTVCAQQKYPSRPVRMIAAAAGGANDIPARLISQSLSVQLGQPFVVVNQPGGLIAGDMLAKAPPDGYTTLFYGGTLWLLPLLQDGVAWDPLKDFAPITLASGAPNVLVVTPSLPVKTVKELIALAKSQPGKLNYAKTNPGAGNQIAGDLFKIKAGLDVVAVSYKGIAQALIDVVAGRIHYSFPAAASITGMAKAGKIRSVAVTSLKPSALAPGLPTVAADIPGYESNQVHGMFSTGGTPAAIINLLNREVTTFLNTPSVRERFMEIGLEIYATSPEVLTDTIKSDMAALDLILKEVAKSGKKVGE